MSEVVNVEVPQCNGVDRGITEKVCGIESASMGVPVEYDVDWRGDGVWLGGSGIRKEDVKFKWNEIVRFWGSILEAARSDEV